MIQIISPLFMMRKQFHLHVFGVIARIYFLFLMGVKSPVNNPNYISIIYYEKAVLSPYFSELLLQQIECIEISGVYSATIVIIR